MKQDRCYRTADIKVVKRDEAEQGYYVEGYALIFE